jgi:replicative DNA helicase
VEAEGNRALTEEENIIIDQEIEAINQELEKLRGTQIHRETYPPVKDKSRDIKEAIGIHTEEPRKPNEPIFLKPSRIKNQKRDLSQVLLSGINMLDKRIIGFNPGELSIWSGSNGSGKSSILSQIAIEVVNQNFNTALFSGELRADKVLNWLQLQAAGIRHSISTQYENYYTVPDNVKQRVNEWLDSRLFIYNNDYGTRVVSVLSAIKDCIEKQNIRMVIIDNMMSLDLASFGGEKYEKQTSLVLALCELAKQTNVHIHFVAHPRKSLGFLRKNDISGTADITNAADNVFIVHRVNSDFKRTTKLDLGLKEDNLLYQYSNVIEICKNRDLGIADEFVGLHFEKESKRFLNWVKERKQYGWEADRQGFYKVDDNEKLPFDE